MIRPGSLEKAQCRPDSALIDRADKSWVRRRLQSAANRCPANARSKSFLEVRKGRKAPNEHELWPPCRSDAWSSSEGVGRCRVLLVKTRSPAVGRRIPITAMVTVLARVLTRTSAAYILYWTVFAGTRGRALQCWRLHKPSARKTFGDQGRLSKSVGFGALRDHEDHSVRRGLGGLARTIFSAPSIVFP